MPRLFGHVVLHFFIFERLLHFKTMIEVVLQIFFLKVVELNIKSNKERSINIGVKSFFCGDVRITYYVHV